MKHKSIRKKASISGQACSFYVVFYFRLNAKEFTILARQHFRVKQKQTPSDDWKIIWSCIGEIAQRHHFQLMPFNISALFLLRDKMLQSPDRHLHQLRQVLQIRAINFICRPKRDLRPTRKSGVGKRSGDHQSH